VDEFLKIEAQELKGIKGQKEKKKNFVDKERVARLKKNFLPYWAREIETEPRQENSLGLNK